MSLTLRHLSLLGVAAFGAALWLHSSPDQPAADHGADDAARYDDPYAARQKFVFERMPVETRVRTKRMQDTPAGYTLPIASYLQAQQQRRQMPRTALGGIPAKTNAGLGSSWQSLGPGNQGGRSRAMVIDPNNPDIMYLAAVTGGVFKTTDGGASWTAVGDTLPVLTNASLAMDPNDSRTLYLGTGEIFGFGTNNVRFAGNGIYRSTDAGTTWNPIGQPAQSNAFDFISDIVFSPGSSQRLYAATNAGIFRSDDAGASWSTSYIPPFGAFVTNGCTDLAIRNDGGNDLLIAACEISGSSDIIGHILRNPDAANGNTWTSVATGSEYGRIALAIAPSNPDVMYAQVANTNTRGSQAILRSTDAGQSWAERVSRPADNAVPSMGQIMLSNPLECPNGGKVFSDYDASGQGDYDNVIAVDPLNENIVWAGGIDLFRSDDGGANWSVASYWFLPQDADDYTHADHHGIVFHPDYNGSSVQAMYALSDGGVQRTDNPNVAGLHGSLDTYCNHASFPIQPDQLPISWTNLNNGVVALQFYHGLPDPTDNRRYLGGSQDNGTNLGTDAGGINGWREISGGDGGYVAVDPSNPNVLFSEFTRLSIVRFSDGGATRNSFVDATGGISDPNDAFPFINPFLMDPNNPQRLWTAGDRVWRTDNQGNNWTAASSQQFSDNNRASAYAVAPGNSNLVLIGRSDGSLLRNTNATLANGATNWSEITLSNGYVSSLAFEPGNPLVVYATISSLNTDHLLRSADAGLSWTAIDRRGQSNGIPDIPVHTIAIDPDNTQRLIVGTDLGIFVSTDGGSTWAVENEGLAPVIVENLAINRIGGSKTLFAFTYGRGAYRLTLDGVANTAPVANDDTASVAYESSDNSIDVLANDTDADTGQTLTVTAVGTPNQGGSVQISGGSGLSYSPASGFSGTETFDYTVSDGNGGSDTATVTVTVSAAPNQAPVANDDAASVAFASSNNQIDVLANDTDADSGQTLTVTAVGTPNQGGAVQITGGGSVVSYAPASDFSGTESFSYTISDGNGGSDSANVSVSVAAAPTPPRQNNGGGGGGALTTGLLSLLLAARWRRRSELRPSA